MSFQDRLLYYWNQIEAYDYLAKISDNASLTFFYRLRREILKARLEQDLGVIVEKSTYNS